MSKKGGEDREISAALDGLKGEVGEASGKGGNHHAKIVKRIQA